VRVPRLSVRHKFLDLSLIPGKLLGANVPSTSEITAEHLNSRVRPVMTRIAQLSARVALMENELQYDPLEAPEPEEWLAIDEAERINLVKDYHRRARVRLPNEKLHAVFHVVVENHIALGNEIPVQSTVQRLMAEGLDRHEAIHAIASVLAEFMHDLINPGSSTESNPAYFTALQQLTAEGWLEP
jgi:hypothetical protein